jgi:LuxR family transcriptional regulator, maltose regulon positive regulatory protein
VTSGAGDVLLTTKLFPPTPRSPLVHRERLFDLLRRGLGTPLTVVSAPAGWGKSSLVSDWLRCDRVTAGWVSLDRGDADPMVFWHYLLLAAQRAGSAAAGGALRRLEAAGSLIDRDVLPTFLNGLLSDVDPVVLVLDDYHLVGGERVHRSLGTVLERCPPQLHVIVVTRADPPLPLGRMRLGNELVEVRAAQLAFSADEAAAFFGGQGAGRLAARDVARLVDRTEGWAAGLQLAALRLRERGDPVDFVDRFTGADRHVVDYLGEEVLANLPAHLLDFLLSTCVLDRVCAPLGAALTGRSDAAAVLEEIARADLFLIPLDEDRRWFRYHHLFGGLLRHELERSRPGEAARLHRRAAGWFAAAGEHAEAVKQALASGDPELAGRHIATAWRPEFNAGRWETVHAWLAALPPALVAGEPPLSVARVWVALDSGRIEEVATALAEAAARGSADAHLQVLYGLYAYKTGDLAAATEHLDKVEPQVQDPFVATVHRLLSGVVALWSGELDLARSRLDEAARRAEADSNRLGYIYAQGCRALVAVASGDLVGAQTLTASAEAAVAATPADSHFVAMFPALARARSGLPRAGPREREAADSAVELARRGAGRLELAAALLTAAAMAPAPDPQVLAWVQEARDVVRHCADAGPVVSSWLEAAMRRVAHGPPGADVVEPLTERELDILRLLPGPTTQRELADSLFVTPNTLKTHLRAVYRKLGAQSRSDAVVRARRRGLI